MKHFFILSLWLNTWPSKKEIKCRWNQELEHGLCAPYKNCFEITGRPWDPALWTQQTSSQVCPFPPHNLMSACSFSLPPPTPVAWAHRSLRDVIPYLLLICVTQFYPLTCKTLESKNHVSLIFFYLFITKSQMLCQKKA